MMPAAKHLDPVIGIDIHIVALPPPAPPVPIPHPHVGVVMDPCDYLPYIGSTVTIGGMHRAQAGSGGMLLPLMAHLPLGVSFTVPPGNENEVFMGSATVAADGDAFSHLSLPALSCVDVGIPAPFRMGKPKKTMSLVLPVSQVLAIPGTVTVGGPPTISLMALGMRAALAIAGRMLRGLKGKIGDWLDARRARRAENGLECVNGHPVDSITGVMYDTFVDAKAGGESLFEWYRHYRTCFHADDGAVGVGFRHGYDHRLLVTPQGCFYETPEGVPVPFERLEFVGAESRVHGRRLVCAAPGRFELSHGKEPLRVFELPPWGGPRAFLRFVRRGERELELRYDGQGRLSALFERSSGEAERHYRVHYDHDGHVAEVHRPEGLGSKRLCAYGYDRRACMVAAENAAGGRHRYEYDERRLMTRWEDPRGYSFWWRYDAERRCVETAGEDGLWWAKLEYDPEKRETHVTERNGGVYVYKYDERSTLLERHDPYGGVKVREVGDDGRVLREVDSGGRAMTFLYDAQGVHTARVDHLGNVYPPQLEMPILPDPMELVAPATPLLREHGTLARVLPRGTASLGTLAARLPRAARVAASDIVEPLPPATAQPERRYDALGNVVEEIDPLGRRRTYEYDEAGNLVVARDAEGRETRTPQARWNLVGAEIDALGRATRYEYTSTEQVSRVTDPGGTSTELEYDEKDRLVEVRRHGVVRETYEYDPGDRLVCKRDGAGNVLLELTYDARSLVSEVKLGDGGRHVHAYDAGGRPLVASTEAHEVEVRRTAFGAVLSDTVDGEGVVHGYLGLRPGWTTTLGRFPTLYRWDDVEGALTIVDPTGGQHHVRHDVGEGLTLRRHASGTVELTQFDDQGRVLGRVRHRRAQDGAEVVHTLRYRYSAEGDLCSVLDSECGRTDYETDEAHRLVAEIGPDRQRREYALDAGGNLVGAPWLGHVVTSENRLVEVNGERFEHDHRNHVTRRVRRDGSEVRYEYDAFDMLVRVEDGHPEGAWEAEYDALGRRLSAGRGEAKTRFYWDEHRLAAEVRPLGSLRIYVYAAPEALVPLLFVDYASTEAEPESGAVYALFTDQLGMPTRVEDATGRTVWSAARIDPYGALEVDPSSELELSLRWPGHYHDAETGLHYNRFRYYDPALGRYLQSDPMGLAGGLNLYAYAPNPVVQLDVFGLAHSWRARASARLSAATRHIGEGLSAARLAVKGRVDASRLTRHLQAIQDHASRYARRMEAHLGLGANPRAAGSTQARMTEAMGELDATRHMMANEPGAELARGFAPGTGFDQVWVRRGPDGEVSEFIIVEAKGPGADLAPDQMSDAWVRSRADQLAESAAAGEEGRALGAELQRALSNPPPPAVTSRVLQSDGAGGVQQLIPVGVPAQYN